MEHTCTGELRPFILHQGFTPGQGSTMGISQSMCLPAFSAAAELSAADAAHLDRHFPSSQPLTDPACRRRLLTRALMTGPAV